MRGPVQWVHVEYGTARSAHFNTKQTVISRAFGVAPQVLVVQNDSRVPVDGHAQIHGSNQLREFSAWDEGVRYLRKRGCAANWWIFSNDTFSQHRFFWGTVVAGFARTFRARYGVATPAIIGDVLPGSLLAPPPATSCYVSTYFFIVNTAAMERLGWSLTKDAHLDWVSSSADLSLASETCPMRVRNFLHEHLCDPDSVRAWRGASPPTEDNKEFLRFKAAAVLLEHTLSHRALQSGIALLPIIDRTSLNALRLMRSMEARLSRIGKARSSTARGPTT